jgi:DNA polymerase III epsilon subunit-like protein
MALNFYIIDTETNGLKVSWHEINQISVIRCEDRFQKTFNIKIEYPQRSSKEALEIQGKTIADLQKGVPKLEVIEEIESFLAEDGKNPEFRCMVAHNAPFDKNHLHAMWTSVGRRFPADLWMCTIAFSRKFAKKIGVVKPKLNLQAALKLAGIEPKPGAHSAAVDVWNTRALWEKLMSENLEHVSVIKNIPHLEKRGVESERDMGIFED